jgi:hypothetical protein
MVNPEPRIVDAQSDEQSRPAQTDPVKVAANNGAAPDDRKRDIFDDLSSLRLNQNFIETAGVKKLYTTVPVRKPGPQDFVRVNPDPDYRENLAMIELKDDREVYLVPPSMAEELPGEFFMATVYTAINRQNVVFLWPVRLPGTDGKVLAWHQSAADAAELAMKRWVRIKANMSLGAYDTFEAPSTIPDPKWPELSFSELLRIAFKHHLVADIDHHLIKRLRGLA